ncbi:MAG: hypothetical protein Q7262_05120 [Bacteroidales bacterium]|nr:hypothetical protein [Bacteroidales bacterium]
MKKSLVLLIFVFAIQSLLLSQEMIKKQSFADKKTFHDIQYGLSLVFSEIGPIPAMDLATTHRLRIGNSFSLGVGVSTIYFVTLTPYAYTRIDIKSRYEQSRAVPYFYLKAGYLIYLIESESDSNSIHLEPGFGYSFLSKRRSTSWTVFIAANSFQGRVFPKTGVAFEF